MNRKHLPRALAAALVFAGCGLLATEAFAQSSWNRRAEAMAVTAGASAGLHDVHLVLELHGDGATSVPLDLTTVVELSINRAVVASATIPASVDPGAGTGCIDASACGGSCGTGTADGLSQTLLCLADGACSPLCDCKCKFPPITWTFPDQAVVPHDEIMVILYPAPGALPDGDTADDRIVTTFSEPFFWDRTLRDVTVVPSPTTMPDNFFEIIIDVDVFHEGLLAFLAAGEEADLGMDVEVRVNGVPAGVLPVEFRPVPIVPSCTCPNACATWDGSTHQCTPYVGGDCMCGWPWRGTIPGVPLQTGDEIMVLLRPAPGALPELPDFPDDEMMLTCCPGITGVETIAAPAGERLEQNRPNPFRARTTIAFHADAGIPVTLELFDVLGRRVRTLVDGKSYADGGRQTASWDGIAAGGERAPAGMYFYRLTSDGRTETRKLTLSR